MPASLNARLHRPPVAARRAAFPGLVAAGALVLAGCPARTPGEPPVPYPPAEPGALHDFLMRWREACPHYFDAPEPETTTVVLDFPEELRWGYPRASLAGWLRGRRSVQAGFYVPFDGCRRVQLTRSGEKIIGELIFPRGDDSRSKETLDLEPLLVRRYASVVYEQRVGGEWVVTGGSATTCRDPGDWLGVLTEVGDERAVFAGQPVVLSASCHPPYRDGCSCPTVLITARLKEEDCAHLVHDNCLCHAERSHRRSAAIAAQPLVEPPSRGLSGPASNLERLSERARARNGRTMTALLCAAFARGSDESRAHLLAHPESVLRAIATVAAGGASVSGSRTTGSPIGVPSASARSASRSTSAAVSSVAELTSPSGTGRPSPRSRTSQRCPSMATGWSVRRSGPAGGACTRRPLRPRPRERRAPPPPRRSPRRAAAPSAARSGATPADRSSARRPARRRPRRRRGRARARPGPWSRAPSRALSRRPCQGGNRLGQGCPIPAPDHPPDQQREGLGSAAVHGPGRAYPSQPLPGLRVLRRTRHRRHRSARCVHPIRPEPLSIGASWRGWCAWVAGGSVVEDWRSWGPRCSGSGWRAASPRTPKMERRVLKRPVARRAAARRAAARRAAARRAAARRAAARRG